MRRRLIDRAAPARSCDSVRPGGFEPPTRGLEVRRSVYGNAGSAACSSQLSVVTPRSSYPTIRSCTLLGSQAFSFGVATSRSSGHRRRAGARARPIVRLGSGSRLATGRARVRRGAGRILGRPRPLVRKTPRSGPVQSCTRPARHGAVGYWRPTFVLLHHTGMVYACVQKIERRSRGKR